MPPASAPRSGNSSGSADRNSPKAVANEQAAKPQPVLSQSKTTVRDRELERLIAASMNARRSRWIAKLSIDVRNGVVTLSGYVSSNEEKKIAAEAASSVRGVGRAIDKLVVDKEKAGKLARPIAVSSDLPLGLIVFGGAAVVALAIGIWWWATLPPAEVLVPVFLSEGTAHFQGEPMDGATLTFHPKGAGAEAVRPRAKVGPSGQFKVGTYAPTDGAPVGQYTVTAEWRKNVVVAGEVEAGPSLLPNKYSSPQSSPLEARVWEGPINRLQFKLTR